MRGLAGYDVLDAVSLDLTEIHNLGYYTGISFEVLAPGIGYRLASGGRYDNLVGTFGAAQPAVGLAFGIERLLLALREQADVRPIPTPMAPDILVSTDNDRRAFAVVEEGRNAGLWIAVDLERRHGAGSGAGGRRNGYQSGTRLGKRSLSTFRTDRSMRQRQPNRDDRRRGAGPSGQPGKRKA